MSSLFNGLLNNIEVSTKDKYIFIEGISPDTIRRDIRKLMNKSEVANNFIIIVGWKIIKIPEFFALEFYILLKMLIGNRKSLCDVRQIGKIISELEKNTWIGDINVNFPSKMDYKLQDDFTAKLFDFQSKFLEKYDQTTQRYHLNGMLLAGAAGSGKTLTSLVTLHCLKCNKIFIVCPKNAVEKVWVDNIIRFFKVPQTYWVSTKGVPYNNERFIVCHYEAMEKTFDFIKDIKAEGNFGIILDESHNLNEIKTKRAEVFIDLCKRLNCKNIIFASGTPIKALAMETLPMFSVLDNFFTDDVAEIFKKLYSKNLDVVKDLMRRRLNEVVYKIEKSQLGLDEPVFNYLNIKTPNCEKYTLDNLKIVIRKFVQEETKKYKKNMPKYIDRFNAIVDSVEKKLRDERPRDKSIKTKFDEYRKTVDHIRKFHDANRLMTCKEDLAFCNKFEKETIMANIDDNNVKLEFKEIKTIVKYYRFKIQGDVLGKIVLGARVDATKEIATHINYKTILNSTKKKTVVFTSYVEVAEVAISTLQNSKYNPIGVYGKYTSNLKNIVTQFETTPDINPLIATYASLSTAVPLVVADTMLLLNVPYRDYILNQAISRIHRLGSDTQCCINFVSLDTGDKPNITTRTVDILKWSQEEIEKIVGMEIPYKIEEVKDYKDVDAMSSVIHKGVAELALTEGDTLADKFIAFMKKVKPTSIIRNW